MAVMDSNTQYNALHYVSLAGRYSGDITLLCKQTDAPLSMAVMLDKCALVNRLGST